MSSAAVATSAPPRSAKKVAPPCILVILGASGDLTKRLLMPTLYNLACDGLLSPKTAIVGMAAETNKLVTALGVPVDEVFLADRAGSG